MNFALRDLKRELRRALAPLPTNEYIYFFFHTEQ